MSVVRKGMISETINGIQINTSIKCNPSNYTNQSNRDIKYIVMHYTGNSKDTSKNNAVYFNGGSRSASAHFFVDESSIYQSVELRDKAWHCGCSQGYKTACRNDNSIGIEMCCSGNYKIAIQTQINSAYLCAYLCSLIGVQKNNVDTFVLRHYDVVKSNKSCPEPMVKDYDLWEKFKKMVKNILDHGHYEDKKTYDGNYPKLPASSKRTYYQQGDGNNGGFCESYDVIQIKRIQKFLNWVGIKYDGKKLAVTGYYDSSTAYCVGQFQGKVGLKINKQWGTNTLSKAKTYKK